MKKLCKFGIFNIDPGWNCGLAVVSLDGPKPKVVYLDTLPTKPSGKKSGLLKADDDWRRGSEVWDWLQEAADQVEQVVAVFIESTQGGKGSRALYSMGYNKSLADNFARHLGAPAFHVSAQAVKKAATGKTNATKVQVQAAMIERVPHMDWSKFNKNTIEHAADACAIFLAGWKLPELQAFMRLVHVEER